MLAVDGAKGGEEPVDAGCGCRHPEVDGSPGVNQTGLRPEPPAPAGGDPTAPRHSQPANRRLTAPLGAQPTLQESAPFHGADA